MTDEPLPQPGWYPDPSGTPLLRWWDGESWTPQTHPLPGTPATEPAPGATAEVAAPERSRTLRVVALVMALLLIALVAVVALSGSLLRPRLATDGIEAQIAQSIADQVNGSTTVTCPDRVDLGRGTSFVCDVAVQGGQTAKVKVTQTDDKGSVEWSVLPSTQTPAP